MENKYLEKIAGMFESTDYLKTLNHKDRVRYSNHYMDASHARSANQNKIFLGNVAAGLGLSGGSVGGAVLGEYLGKHFGNAGKKYGTLIGMAIGATGGSIPGVKMMDSAKHEYAKRNFEHEKSKL